MQCRRIFRSSLHAKTQARGAGKREHSGKVKWLVRDGQPCPPGTIYQQPEDVAKQWPIIWREHRRFLYGD
jgi:hypothetical protein